MPSFEIKCHLKDESTFWSLKTCNVNTSRRHTGNILYYFRLFLTQVKMTLFLDANV